MDRIVLGHGSGGRLGRDLVEKMFVKHFKNPVLDKLEDSAVVSAKGGKIAFTTDSYVVNPIEFPGGDIGKIAVCGTVNDLSVKGAVPKYLSASFILEEGLECSLLEKIVLSMKKAADEAGVFIVTGDTKVVEKGKADRIFITTSGVGIFEKKTDFSPSKIKKGDCVLISGILGAHGVSVMNARHDLGIKGNVKSDVAPLNELTRDMIKASSKIRTMRDLTRGGLVSSLNEIASAGTCAIEIDEALLPKSQAVESACDILGLDSLYVANEGKLVAFVDSSDAQKVLSAMQKNKFGKDAAIVGQVVSKSKPEVCLKTKVGGLRTLRMSDGEQLPRIC
jgi:hydrogenase expression/formation protein HypE